MFADTHIFLEMENHEDASTLEPLDAVRFSWLFWGGRKIARNEQLLRRRKIAYIINCTPPCGDGGVPNFHERLTLGSKAAFKYLRIPIYDTQTETLQPHFEEVWEFMETCRTREDGHLLIHCNHGVSRSVAFVCSYLIKFAGMSFDEALSFVRRKNPLASPNEAFRDQLRQLRERVLKESRSGGSEPCEVQNRGWVPPSSSSRKRVAACSLPNLRPQPRAMRQLGPARPPSMATALPFKEHASMADKTCNNLPNLSHQASAAPFHPDLAGKEVEVVSLLEASEPSDPSPVRCQVEPPMIPAPPTHKGTCVFLQGITKTSGYSFPPPTPNESLSLSNINGEVDLCSNASNDSVGCKDTPLQEEPPVPDSDRALPCVPLDSQQLQDAANNQTAKGDCGSRSAHADPTDPRDPSGTVVLTIGATSLLCAPHEAPDAAAAELAPLAEDIDRSTGLSHSRGSTVWSGQRLVDPQEGRETLKATVLSVV